jgi:hypothetical protein
LELRGGRWPFDLGNGRAAVIYTDDTITKDSLGNPLPQIVLAQQQ